ncbi:MAG: bacillithiol system redox-active protein YtxJ [Thermoanaerobaculia bacterium]|nr:bacillithiol system redox-active protein YtxJ [Thermoanaerobaculia bacterium]
MATKNISAPILPRVQDSTDIDRLWEASQRGTVFLMKHSLICGTSHAAIEQYAAFAAAHSDEATFSILEIQPHRDLSREVEERSGVRHQSPQVLRIRKGQVDWSATHWSITESKLQDALAEAS